MVSAPAQPAARETSAAERLIRTARESGCFGFSLPMTGCFLDLALTAVDENSISSDVTAFVGDEEATALAISSAVPVCSAGWLE
jgi:hypothetical protein